MSAAGAAWESTSKFVIILHAGHNCARRPCALLVRALFISPKLPRAVHPLSRGGMSFRRPRCSAGSAHEWLNSLPAAPNILGARGAAGAADTRRARFGRVRTGAVQPYDDMSTSELYCKAYCNCGCYGYGYGYILARP